MCIRDRQEVDRYAVLFVSAQRLNTRGRLWHSLLYDKRSALGESPVAPWHLTGDEKWIRDVGSSNLWINMGASNVPLFGPEQALPEANRGDLPPASAEYRPSHGHARAQLLMANSVAIGLHNGWAEDGSENYMPLPTIHQSKMDVVGRKYLMSALSFAQFPNFVGFYTDIYSKPDWHGGVELSVEELEAVQKDLFAAACKAAGFKQTPEPSSAYPWNKKLPDRFKNKLGAKEFNAIAGEYVNQNYGGDWNRLINASAMEQRKAWNKMWETAIARAAKANKADKEDMVGPEEILKKKQVDEEIALEEENRKSGRKPSGFEIPEPEKCYPFPWPSGIDLSVAGPDADLRYTGFVQSGIARCYATITRFIEQECPALFTIHNRRRENHRDAGYSFKDWTRGPSIPPEFCRGATVIFSSEWNLDNEPQPFNGPTHYCQTLVDEGRPVWATATHCRNGGQGRFLRDGIFLAGRGVNPVYEQPGTATWSFKGADQSAYAARDRLAATIDFLNRYEDVFEQLEAVREVGLYVGPFWTDHASYLGFPAALFTGYQVHMVCHEDAVNGAFKKGYRIIFAPWMPIPHLRESMKKFFSEFIAAGGHIVAAITDSKYLGEIDRSKWGIKNKAQAAKNDGEAGASVDSEETPEQRAQMTREVLWGFAGNAVEVVPYDFATRWACLLYTSPSPRDS